jgi:hypothetical protein
LIWGECQGSGANPYQVRVDLEDVAYKCSCPSRKLPCKHTLGLLLLLAKGTPFAQSEPAGFVEEWSANRAKRAETKAAKAAQPEKPVDAEQQAKRIEKRESRIEAGLDLLESWLSDVVSQGLIAARAQPASFWEQTAARLVDSQAPGLARRVRELADEALTTNDWQDRLLTGLGRFQLLVDAYRRLDALPPALAAEVRSMVGWTQNQDTLRERAGVRDHWHVVGRRLDDTEQLRVQYNWLLGQQTRRTAMVLEFAVGKQPLVSSFVVDQCLDATLVYFDGEPELRALLKERHGTSAPRSMQDHAIDWQAMQQQYAAHLARNPWFDRMPVIVGPLRPAVVAGELWLFDAAMRGIRLPRACKHGWHLAALSAAGPLTVFGEWTGATFDPITAECSGKRYSMTMLGDIPVLADVA